MDFDRKIITEDGQEFYGWSFGAVKEAVCELVFNTSMVGYQEILSDPSYADQAVVMTYPLIGNYGMADEDYERRALSIGALIVREYNDKPSNHRSRETLGEVCKRKGIPGIFGVDTRKIARTIRDLGSRKALLTAADMPLDEGRRRLRDFCLPTDAVSRVSVTEIHEYESGENVRFHVVAVDCGMKASILKSLAARGCRVTVVPWDTPAELIRELAPDGVFLSNGPGNPQDVGQTISAVRELLGKYPLFGICLGHQILALAYGAETYKLKFGHRGGNHPVKNLSTGRIEITSQNHSFAVVEESLAKTRLSVTHRNLLDGTIEGVECLADRAFSVQYHPESAPGPQDSAYLFDRFIRLMEESGHA